MPKMTAEEKAAWLAQREAALEDYDVPEVSVLEKMKRIMIDKHDYEVEDFYGMSFLDIESEFLDTCGEVDFRSAE